MSNDFRQAFEQWYVENCFDLENNPIQSRQFVLQWTAWCAAAKALAPEVIELKRQIAENEEEIKLLKKRLEEQHFLTSAAEDERDKLKSNPLVTLQCGVDGVWAHFRRIRGQSCSVNLSANNVTRKWALAYVAESQPQPTKYDIKHQYYYKDTDCTAMSSGDPDCICWHNEGSKPFEEIRHDDVDTHFIWREKSDQGEE